jgi:type II secretory pathway predicted ATPase ExeA
VKRKLQALFGLKWNPFLPDVPTEALHRGGRLCSFSERVLNLASSGGFALLTGDSGTGKSATLRIVSKALAAVPDVAVGVLTRPQASLFDFYRELGELFGVKLSPCNRWGGTKALREGWLEHVERTGVCPALVVDEAQEVRPDVLSEIRLVSSYLLDSKNLLVVVLAGDSRLTERLKTPELAPIASRVRVRLTLEPLQAKELGEVLAHLVAEAGNPRLLSEELAEALCEHAQGNLRTLMNMAAELLDHGVRKDVQKLDEKLFFELYGELETVGAPSRGARRRAR